MKKPELILRKNFSGLCTDSSATNSCELKSVEQFVLLRQLAIENLDFHYIFDDHPLRDNWNLNRQLGVISPKPPTDLNNGNENPILSSDVGPTSPIKLIGEVKPKIQPSIVNDLDNGINLLDWDRNFLRVKSQLTWGCS